MVGHGLRDRWRALRWLPICIFLCVIDYVFLQMLIAQCCTCLIVVFMKQTEAVSLLKLMLEKFDFLQGASFAVMPPDSDNVPSEGYQIHIKTELDAVSVDELREFASNYGLTLALEKVNLIVIYKPAKKAKQDISGYVYA